MVTKEELKVFFESESTCTKKSYQVTASELAHFVDNDIKLAELIRRPELTYEELAPFDKNRPEMKKLHWQQAEIEIKYEGYIKKQLMQVEQMHRLEEKKIPEDIDYKSIHGLRLEAIEKLNRVRPMNIGQASRISGVSPADVSVLLIYIQK